MSNNSLLLTLIDPISPVTISMIPETLGWKMIALILLVSALMLTMRTVKRFCHNRYRRVALSELHQLNRSLVVEPGNNADRADLQQQNNAILHKLNQILKRTAMEAYPNQPIAGLYGEDWLEFLSTTCNRVSFVSSPFLVWQTQLFQGNELTTNNEQCWTVDGISQVIEHAQMWVAHHQEEQR